MAAASIASTHRLQVVLWSLVLLAGAYHADAFVGVNLPRVQLRTAPVMCAPEDPVDPKKLARGVGGILGNLKSGQGLFGAEATQRVARQAIEIVEDQVLDTAAEIRAETEAERLKASGQAKPMTAPPPADLPADGKLDVTVGHDEVGEAIGVTVKPTQKVGLLLKAWAGENEVGKDDYRLIVRGVPVDPEALISECGLSDNEMIAIRTRP